MFAKEAKVPFIVDNTVATPYLLNPIEHGANIVIHSLTKYVNGNGTAMGGIIIEGGTFNYGNGLFPEFTDPSPNYHGLNYHEALGPAAFIARVRVEGLRDLGAAPSPFNSFQILQGIETLSVRMSNHSKNALELAQWLESQDEVKWVNYPGLKSSKYNDLSKKYLPKGQSGIITFGVKGGYDFANDEGDVKDFLNRARRRAGLSPNNGLRPDVAFYKLWDGLGHLTTKSDGATRKAVADAVYENVLKPYKEKMNG